MDVLANETDPRAELRKEIQKLERSIDFNPQDSTYINKLNELAKEIRFYQADSLLQIGELMLDLSEAADYQAGKSKANMRLADYYSDRGQNAKAIRYYKRGLTLAEGDEHQMLRLKGLNSLSGEFAYKGDYGSALNGYLEALELAQELDELIMQSIILENIANLYSEQKDYEAALAYYKKVKRLNDSIDNEVIKAETMSNLGSLYADMGNLEYAMFNVNQSIDIFEEHRIMDWLAYAYETKGKIYLKKYNYKWALYWYNQSDMLHLSLDDQRARIDLLNGMAQAYFGKGNDSLASVYATDAFRISNEINFTNGKRDCAKTLYRIHRNREDYATALAYHELFQQLSDSLARSENRQSLNLHKTKDEYERQKAELIENNEKALAKQKRYIRIGWVILLIATIIIYLVWRSKKLQKQLTAELQTKQEFLEKRKAELQDISETKTKLFSIIGHDLRGPIGALQGLLKMFKDGDLKREEFLTLMPKLRGDVDHIYFTLNNLLSWGNSQLEGSITKAQEMDMQTVVQDNINLLSELAERKSIRIVSKVDGSVQTWSDPNQIDIVIRNLISNAIKFTPHNGMVTLKARELETEWEISVRDTGMGMDRITLGKLFQDKTHHTTYGTDKEKGTGLGLSLCKEMVEKNNGRIWVESIMRKGSTFYFTLPKACMRGQNNPENALGKAV
ncbi:Tetratricopeptide repeat-containing protein [Robiginitalea myxolifaciens]|uniref:histidine kinase n=1 Tax=Robiginitalea myxolifaciens TaxID=400055 RepID=A0A1I6H0T2_9FLAO|nr:tetratricopeptide repeat-containing sensor histidine kinase [Robiginitalea myxolifaciens]SFR48063.1 Tetratricopeptide repeat-containing protein [Robiginitalea myxolifaciens]